MTTEQVVHYRDMSAEYLSHARSLLAEGDLKQASEKAWGAVAVLVKAAAESRGWRHQSHRHLWEALGRLEDETGDAQMREQFGLAGELHTNYYEEWLDEKTVARYVAAVEQLVVKLDPLAS